MICTRKVNKTPIKSNDTHILAIALVEKKARLLFGSDTNLHKDFTNPRIINDPRGSIYQNKTHIEFTSINTSGDNYYKLGCLKPRCLSTSYGVTNSVTKVI